MAEQLVNVPDLGGTDSVEIIELSVAPGDKVEEGQSILVVESDKASMDIPAPFAGTITEVLVGEGTEVSEGDPLVKIDTESSNSSDVESAPHAESETAVQPEDSVSTQEDNAQPVAPAASTEGSGGLMNVTVPDLGGADSVEIIELVVSVGDSVSEGDSLLVLESDKASMDMPAPASGVISKVLVAVGDSVAEGDQVFELESSSAAPVQAVETAKSAAPQVAESQPSATVARQSVGAESSSGAANENRPVSQASGDVYAGPAVRKLARELGVDLQHVKGTGPKGRIAKEDLHEFVKRAVKQGAGRSAAGLQLPEAPAIDFAKFGEIETRPMSKMEKVTAANMQRSWLTVPHVTHFDDADITELEVFRKSLKPEMEKRGVKVSPLAFVVKAVAATLKSVPKFNVSIGPDGQSIVEKQYVHIGMAVDTPHGLLVPVLRDVDRKGLWEIAAEIIELAGKARDRKLKPQEMQGACFTISSLGQMGGKGFTPIVNTPEVGILGVSNSSVQPVFVDGEFVPRTLMPLALSYDHRVINGGDAGRFMTQLTASMADLRRLLL